MSELEQGEEHEYGLLVPVGHVQCPDAVEPGQAATQAEPVYVLTRGEVGGICGISDASPVRECPVVKCTNEGPGAARRPGEHL